jgi:microcystin-dependent protein
VSDPFVAEIRIFAGNFAPKGWASCDGQLLPISQNTALFSLLGTMYGGDGKSTFALPNMAGNAPMMWGQGGGLSLHDEGEMSGSETVTLLDSEMPAHNHNLRAVSDPGTLQIPTPTRALARSQNANAYKAPAGQPTTNMAFQGLAPAGSSFPHNNMMPFLTLYFIIALQGVFPPRG